MPGSAAPSPADLPALKRWLAERPDADQLRPLAIQHILIQPDALANLPAVLDELPASRRVVLVLDDTPMRRGSDDLKPLVHEVLTSNQRRVEPFVFRPGEDGLVHADLAGVAHLRAAIGLGPASVVALGSGTVCDMAKQACALAEAESSARIGLVLVPTAASVTAFTSTLSVLLKDGVKRTFNARFPDAVVCDLETLAQAPTALTLAGLGDCCARFVSYGDWYLAHQLGLVEAYSETPLALMGEGLDQAYLANAEGVGAGTLEGVAFLVHQVLLAGLAQSMCKLAGPLSGTEHVVSHLLDMGAAAWGRRMALHGAQVGVATPLAARAYELLYDRFDARRPRPEPPAADRMRTIIRSAFLPLDPSGRLAQECWREYRQKLALWNASAARFDAVRDRWTSDIEPRLRHLVRPSATLRAILARAGHPLRFAELVPSIPPEQARFALANAHLIRQRFTIGDLFTFCGDGGDALAADLLAETTELKGGSV